MMSREGITEKPVLAETVDLKLMKSVDHLQLTKVVVTRDGSVPHEQHVKGLKEFARRTIKRFYHAKEKEKLTKYVDAIGKNSIPATVVEKKHQSSSSLLASLARNRIAAPQARESPLSS
jgi:hypothetical protein